MKRKSLGIGTELFRQAFMAIDYLEFRFLPDCKRQSSIKRHPSNSDGKSQEQRKISRIGSHQKSRSEKGRKTSDEILFEGEKNNVAKNSTSLRDYVMSDRGDVPGWVLVVLMTTGLVTALWAIAAPRLNAILKNSLDSMNNIR